jgi:hypothetical protein
VAATTVNYLYQGTYDRTIFQAEFVASFSGNANYRANAIPDMYVLLALIERDLLIVDIRWAAYMLATVMKETTTRTTVERPALNKKGKPLIGKDGKPVMVKTHPWLMMMAPVDEVGKGKGRKYHEPVKVTAQADGTAQIVEQDGDTFKMSAAGVVTAVTKKAVMGTTDGGAAVKAYDDDKGIEQAYYGRGYVQLTWWSNYATTGIAIGSGLQLLLDPELVKQPETAYKIMSHGMRTGDGFANGKTFAKYFTGANTDYIGARAMVNGSDAAAEIAGVAETFEAILLKARVVQPSPQ